MKHLFLTSLAIALGLSRQALYRRLEKYLYEDLNAIFLEGVRNENYVYGCYFVANADAGKTDAIFHSLHFEKISLSREYIGTPAQACESLVEGHVTTFTILRYEDSATTA